MTALHMENRTFELQMENTLGRAHLLRSVPVERVVSRRPGPDAQVSSPLTTRASKRRLSAALAHVPDAGVVFPVVGRCRVTEENRCRFVPSVWFSLLRTAQRHACAIGPCTRKPGARRPVAALLDGDGRHVRPTSPVRRCARSGRGGTWRSAPDERAAKAPRGTHPWGSGLT